MELRPAMAPSNLADQVVLAVKDEMRGVRYRLGEGVRRGRQLAAEGGPLTVLEPMAAVADVVVSGFEAAASALFDGAKRSLSHSAFPLPIESYFDPARGEGENARAFAVVVYAALRGLLRGFGAEACLIQELAIDAAWNDVRRRRRGLIASVVEAGEAASPASRKADVLALSAALALALAERRPIKQLTFGADESRRPKHLLLSPNFYCATAIGLATAIASSAAQERRLDKAEIVAAADAGVDARFSRLIAAARAREPVAALAAEFAAVMPYLS